MKVKWRRRRRSERRIRSIAHEGVPELVLCKQEEEISAGCPGIR